MTIAVTYRIAEIYYEIINFLNIAITDALVKLKMSLSLGSIPTSSMYLVVDVAFNKLIL